MLGRPIGCIDGLQHARALVAIGELADAQREVQETVLAEPESLEAISLLAKVKHIRGELSDAVACWAQTHGRFPFKPVARAQLLAMLDLTRDPERGASEFVAVGQFHLTRKPLAYLALDEAFRHFIAHRPSEARAHCQRVALEYAGRERELVKLAVLCDALIPELTGDLLQAAQTLERLGTERGFEADLDRVTSLVDLYDRIGGPEQLRAALNICRFLERSYVGIPICGRMSDLYARLGNQELCRRYAEMHLERFERGMHRLGASELAAAATTRYLPLALLAEATLGHSEPTEESPEAARLICEAFRGGYPARMLDPGSSATLVERKYAAELTRRRGQTKRAAELYLLILEEDPGDPHLLRLLLGEEEPPASWLVAALREGEFVDAIEATLRRSTQLDPRDPRAWWGLSHLATARETQGAADLRARAAGLSAAQRRAPVGRVLAAAVYRFVGQAKGLIHEVWAARERVAPGDGGHLPLHAVLGNVTEDMKAAVRSAFVAVREYARATYPHLTDEIFDFNYSFRITKDDEPSSGTSAGLPTALAFLSVFLQRAVPQDLAFTGVLVADAHDVLVVRRIGDAEFKVRGAYHRDLRGLVLPEENRAELARSHRIPAPIRDELCLYVGRLDDAARIAFGESL